MELLKIIGRFLTTVFGGHFSSPNQRNMSYGSGDTGLQNGLEFYDTHFGNDFHHPDDDDQDH